MYQYDDPTTVGAIQALPASGTPGHFTDGDPPTVGPTIPRAWWFEMVSSELLAILAAAEVAPVRSSNGQVVAAIEALITAAGVGFTPVQQGGGPSQLTTKLNLGYDGAQLRLAVAGADLGGVALKSDLTTAISALLGGAPAALETLNELAAAINDETNYAAVVTAALATKAPLIAPVLAANGAVLPTTPTPPAGDNSVAIANTAWFRTQLAAITPFTNVATSAEGPWYKWDPLTLETKCWGNNTTAITVEGPITQNLPMNLGTFQGGRSGTLNSDSSNQGATVIDVVGGTATTLGLYANDNQGGGTATATGFWWETYGTSPTQPALAGD